MLLILKLLRARVEEASAEKQIPRRCAPRNDKLSDAWCFAAIRMTRRWGGAKACLFLFLLLY
jgi:hypothetical protein